MSIRKDLQITTAAAAALLLAGCNREPDWTAQSDTRVCRDREGVRVDDGRCERRGGGHGGGLAWFYVGRGGFVPAVGERLQGGSFAPRPGVSYARATSVSRGGFGSSAHGFGGFGG